VRDTSRDVEVRVREEAEMERMREESRQYWKEAFERNDQW
jgi:hypothetical protein